MEFRNLTFADEAIINETLKKYNVGWEYDFATLFCWNASESMQIAQNDGYVCAYNVIGDKAVFMPPYLVDENVFVRAIEEILTFAQRLGVKYRIRGLSKNQADALSSRGFLLATDRNEYDYVYNATDLKYLRGKAYHSKRNFVSRFQKNYAYELKEYSPEDIEGLLALYDSWTDSTTHETMNFERKAIVRALNLQKTLNLKIYVIKIEDKYAAFSVSHIAPNGVAHTMFEKANVLYVGAYQAINNFTALQCFDDNFWVNRQEDMGLDGLRKAKLSYSPAILLEKYSLEG